MNGTKTIFWMLSIFILSFSAYAADGCVSGENCTWFGYGATWASGANFTLESPEGTESGPVPVTEFDSGNMRHVNIINNTGNYKGCFIAYNSTNSETQCESKEIRSDAITEEFDMLGLIFNLILVFGIGAALIIIGEYIGNPAFVIASGIWFLITAFTSLADIPSIGFVSTLFFILVGLAAIYHGIIDIARNRTEA